MHGHLNLIGHSITFDRVLALDLGKFNSVSCIYDPKTQQHRFKRHNAWARSFVQRVSRGMKSRRKIAVVALARKLLVRLWAMLRDNTAWRDPTTRRDKGEDGPDRVGTGGCALSPPEDTAPVTALSSVGVAIG